MVWLKWKIGVLRIYSSWIYKNKYKINIEIIINMFFNIKFYERNPFFMVSQDFNDLVDIYFKYDTIINGYRTMICCFLKI